MDLFSFEGETPLRVVAMGDSLRRTDMGQTFSSPHRASEWAGIVHRLTPGQLEPVHFQRPFIDRLVGHLCFIADGTAYDDPNDK